MSGRITLLSGGWPGAPGGVGLSLAGLLLVGLVLAACGGGGGEPGGSEAVVVEAGERTGAGVGEGEAGSVEVASEPGVPEAVAPEPGAPEPGGPAESEAVPELEPEPMPGATAEAVVESEAVPELEPEPMPDATAEAVVESEAVASAVEEPPPVTVVLDPGHGFGDSGAVGNGIVEADSNLELALRVEPLLVAAGYAVVLTRREAGEPYAPPAGLEGIDPDLPGFLTGRLDRQARVDLANEVEGAVFVSLHSNGSNEASLSGVEAWWDPERPFAAENERLASLLVSHVLASVRGSGYAVFERGLFEDTCWRFSERAQGCFPLFVLGPPQSIERARVEAFGIPPEALGFEPGQEFLRTRATRMPGALLELLFVSNAADALVLANEGGRAAIAAGVASAIVAFLEGEGELPG